MPLRSSSLAACAAATSLIAAVSAASSPSKATGLACKPLQQQTEEERKEGENAILSNASVEGAFNALKRELSIQALRMINTRDNSARNAGETLLAQMDAFPDSRHYGANFLLGLAKPHSDDPYVAQARETLRTNMAEQAAANRCRQAPDASTLVPGGPSVQVYDTDSGEVSKTYSGDEVMAPPAPQTLAFWNQGAIDRSRTEGR
ncbi:MAG: hypothetical protein H6922_06575 [Pseudomonadaceae bacterium]|nr:hypothetical protein [Pseudomonadaceae bacterium]